MKIKKIGDSFSGSTSEYAVLGSCNDVVATFRVSNVDKVPYCLWFNTHLLCEVKEILSFIEGAKIR